MSASRTQHLIVASSLLVAAALLTLMLYNGLHVDQSKVPSALIGQPANFFAADWVQGQQLVASADTKGFNSDDFRGKIVLLNFWASWCVACRAEARDIEAIWQKFAERDVVVVGIAIQDEALAAQEFARNYGKTYILGLDTDGKAAIDYGVTGVPETFLIDRQGTIVFKETGPINREQLEKTISSML